ncbi:MAG: ankyrin repeat domain-containing protein [Nitrospira sp.]|nr:ankyrin repeat domain-containing protein [Nitrospira sp.]
MFVEVLDRARVKGDSGEKLYFHTVNPQLCLTIDSRSCKSRAYLIPNDVVVLGHICGAWAYVMYPGGKRRSEGWVDLHRLERLPPDRDLLYARKKWNHKPEGPPIVVAAFVGDVTDLRQAISSDPVSLRMHGVDALYAAARQNHFELTKALLDLGVDPNDGTACAQLGIVAAHSSVEILKLLVHRGANVNCKPGGQGFTPLMTVAFTSRGNEVIDQAMGRVTNTDLLASAKYLLEKEARVNDVNVFGDSALSLSIQWNNVDIANLLLKGGADVNNYVDGSNSNSSGEQRGHTALMSSVFWFRGDPTMIMLLLKHGADVNYRSKLSYDEECDRTTSGKCTFRGQTALTRAATEGYYTVAKMLLENGADPLLPREDGRIPRLVACDWKHIEVAKLIKKYEDKVLAKSESAAICPGDQ